MCVGTISLPIPEPLHDQCETYQRHRQHTLELGCWDQFHQAKETH